MTPDLLSFLVAPDRSGSAAVQIGVARDLVAARVLARKADEGHPHAKAFVENAQEQLAQAKIRRARAARLRAGAARASRFGYHDLARMGCEAAIEEEREAGALDANVIGAIRATHAEAFGGYSSFSPEEEKMLQRKAFEDSQTSSQREDTMNKLLSNLYASTEKVGGEEMGDEMGGEGDATVDIAAYLHAASAAFGGDLDSVFGADAAERMGAVSRAVMHKVRADLRRKEARFARLGMEAEETRESALGLDDLGLDDLGLDDLGLDDDMGSEAAEERREARQERREQRRQLRLQIKELRRQLKALRHSSDATADAEDERVGVDAAEDEQLEMALSDSADFGADDGDDDDDDGKGSQKKLKAGRVALAIMTAGGSEAVRAAGHAAGKKGSSKVIAKLKTLSDKKVRAIMNDGLRTKAVRLAAKAELKRRAAMAEDGEVDSGSGGSSESDDLAVKVPGAFTEKSYLDSYKGVAPPRRRFVKFFKDRAEKMGADDAEMVARAVQAPEDDSFGGFFSALGDFFSNIFKVGKKDASRISHASRAARDARKAAKVKVDLAKKNASMLELRMKKLKNAFSKTDSEDDRSSIQAQIDALRGPLRDARQAVREAGRAAFDADFAASSSDPSAFPITGSPVLQLGMKDVSAGGTVAGDQIQALQVAFNQFEPEIVQKVRAGRGDLVEDGKFGPDTKSAVILFQKQNGVAADGKVGVNTAPVMAAKWTGRARSATPSPAGPNPVVFKPAADKIVIARPVPTRRASPAPVAPHGISASKEAELNARLARGEITKAQYDQIKASVASRVAKDRFVHGVQT